MKPHCLAYVLVAGISALPMYAATPARQVLDHVLQQESQPALEGGGEIWRANSLAMSSENTVTHIRAYETVWGKGEAIRTLTMAFEYENNGITRARVTDDYVDGLGVEDKLELSHTWPDGLRISVEVAKETKNVYEVAACVGFTEYEGICASGDTGELPLGFRRKGKSLAHAIYDIVSQIYATSLDAVLQGTQPDAPMGALNGVFLSAEEHARHILANGASADVLFAVAPIARQYEKELLRAAKRHNSDNE